MGFTVRAREIMRSPAAKELYHIAVGTDLRRDIGSKFTSMVDSIRTIIDPLPVSAYNLHIKQIGPMDFSKPQISMMENNGNGSGNAWALPSLQENLPPGRVRGAQKAMDRQIKKLVNIKNRKWEKVLSATAYPALTVAGMIPASAILGSAWGALATPVIMGIAHMIIRMNTKRGHAEKISRAENELDSMILTAGGGKQFFASSQSKAVLEKDQSLQAINRFATLARRNLRTAEQVKAWFASVKASLEAGHTSPENLSAYRAEAQEIYKSGRNIKGMEITENICGEVDQLISNSARPSSADDQEGANHDVIIGNLTPEEEEKPAATWNPPQLPAVPFPEPSVEAPLAPPTEKLDVTDDSAVATNVFAANSGVAPKRPERGPLSAETPPAFRAVRIALDTKGALPEVQISTAFRDDLEKSTFWDQPGSLEKVIGVLDRILGRDLVEISTDGAVAGEIKTQCAAIKQKLTTQLAVINEPKTDSKTPVPASTPSPVSAPASDPDAVPVSKPAPTPASSRTRGLASIPPAPGEPRPVERPKAPPKAGAITPTHGLPRPNGTPKPRPAINPPAAAPRKPAHQPHILETESLPQRMQVAKETAVEIREKRAEQKQAQKQAEDNRLALEAMRLQIIFAEGQKTRHAETYAQRIEALKAEAAPSTEIPETEETKPMLALIARLRTNGNTELADNMRQQLLQTVNITSSSGTAARIRQTEQERDYALEIDAKRISELQEQVKQLESGAAELEQKGQALQKEIDTALGSLTETWKTQELGDKLNATIKTLRALVIEISSVLPEEDK